MSSSSRTACWPRLEIGDAGPARGRGPALPLVALAACAAALGVHQLPRLPDAAWLVPLGIVALLALERRAARWVLAAVAAGLWTALVAERRLDDRLPEALTGRDFDVSGWVEGFPTGTPERMTFSFAVEDAADPAVPRRLRLGWYDAPDALRAGAAFALTVRLRAPRGLANPGGFDYEQWLLVEGYGATGYVRSAEALTDPPRSLARWWLGVRRDAADLLAESAPDPAAAALLTALAIGERFGFTDEHWDDLRRSGTSHLVAISGMHVGLVAMLVFVGARRLWLRLPGRIVHYDLEAAAAASALAAIGYAALAGFAVPTQRAVVMVIVALGVAAGRRAVGTANGLAAALLAVMVWDPFAVLAASFWLSFAAVALLCALALRRDVHIGARTRGQRLRRYAAALVALQVSISFGLAPVVAAYFGEVSIVSPLVNLLAIPYFSFVLVPLTLTALAAAGLGLAGAPLLVYGAGLLANWAWAAIAAAASVTWSAIGVAQPSAAVAAFALLGVAAGLPGHPLPGRRLAWCALLPVFVPFVARSPAGVAEVTMLDVGHGLAVVVETRHHRLLYDAGPSFPSGFDTGAEIVVPALAQRRASGLDRLIVSHADNDHSGGVPAVLEAYPAADVLKGPDVTDIPGRVCSAGERWQWDGVHFEVLHPEPGFAPLGNESSCVLKIATATDSLLVTGDAEARAERVLARHPRVAADVVVVGHHGSATSSTPQFVRASHARLALVSAGHANRWGFPRADVVRRWQAAGATLWTTGDSGALSLTLGAGGLAVTAERERRRRYWRSEQ